MATKFFPNYDAIKVTSPFGMRTLGGTTKMHNGIDLVAATKSGGSATDHITAHTGGTVAAVGYNASAGYYINIATDANTVMVYYHLKALPKQKKGATVKTGEILGYMGSTGNSTGAHLHFGIKSFGQWIDPAPFLDNAYTPTVSEKKTISIGMRTLRQGAKGEDVRALQILLTGRGCKGKMHEPDGIFGPNTLGAVKLYQEKSKLDADGVVGKLTWSALLGV